MFDSPFDFFALVIAIVALIVRAKGDEPGRGAAHSGWRRSGRRRPPPQPCPRHSRRLRRSSERCRRLRPGSRQSRRPSFPMLNPSLPPRRRQEAAGGPAAPPPPLPQPDRGFEETIGTRWVVWIGGLTLALGGFFMVRYSIEAGLLGPGVRTMLGGLFALALLLAGEWTRRKESISAIEALPIANIPAILTAAGTAVAFATVYAAYALYGFLVPATAFILLGTGGAGHACRRAAARAGARRSRRRRRLRHAGPGLVRQAGLLGALHLSRHRHRGGLRSGARPAVALARGHHDRVRAVVDVPLPAMRTVDGRPACLPCHRRLHPRRVARGVRLHVRPARGRRPDRADLVRLARGLSARRHADRAEQFSCRHRDDRVRPAGGRQPVRGLAQRCRRRRRRRRRCVGLRRVRRMGGSRQSGHAGAARRAAAGHRTERHGRIGVAASDIGRDLRRRFRRRRIPGAGPLRRPDHPGDLVGGGGVHAAGAAGRALCPHRASRPLDPVRDSRGRCSPRPMPLRPRSSPSAKTGRDCRPRSRCLRPARSPRWRWR